MIIFRGVLWHFRVLILVYHADELPRWSWVSRIPSKLGVDPAISQRPPMPQANFTQRSSFVVRHRSSAKQRMVVKRGMETLNDLILNAQHRVLPGWSSWLVADLCNISDDKSSFGQMVAYVPLHYVSHSSWIQNDRPLMKNYTQCGSWNLNPGRFFSYARETAVRGSIIWYLRFLWGSKPRNLSSIRSNTANSDLPGPMVGNPGCSQVVVRMWITGIRIQLK